MTMGPKHEIEPEAAPEAGVETGVGAGADTSAVEPKLADIVERPLREILVIAAPSVVTMTSYTLMQFVDALMVSRIGPEPVYVAAQGNGGVVAWLLMAVVLGLTGVVNTFVSQHLGAGRPREGAAYAWNALWLSIAAWAALMLPVAALAPFIFEAREAIIGATGGEGGATDPRLMRLQTEYARIMLMGGVFVVCGRAISHYFYGMHRPAVVMIAALAGNLVNIAVNLVLIFGEAGLPVPEALEGTIGGAVLGTCSGAAAAVAGALGVPAMGVAGAALGSVIGAAVELTIPMALFLSPSYARRFGTRAAWRVNMRKIRDIVRIGWPAGAMFANEMFCWTYLMSVLIAAGGAAAGASAVIHNTAGWIGLRYMHLSFMPAVGLSIAMTAIVGKCMGMGRPDLATSRTWLGLRIGLVYMGACAIGFFVLREWMIERFVPASMSAAEAEELVRIGSTVMIAAAVFQVFDAMAIVLSGALRGAGDTVWPGIATILLSWGCIVGLGHLLVATAPRLGSLGPWIGAAAFIITLGSALLWRFVGGKWREIKLVERAPVAESGPAAA